MTGDALRRFVALMDRADRPQPTGHRAPVTKRYRPTIRVSLPEDDPMLPGGLLRRTSGVVQVRWDYDSGLPNTMVTDRRPVPSGGARYPIEVYLANDAGLYHYDPHHDEAELVRVGDHRVAATGHECALAVVFTAVFWRTGIRYADFAYRLQCQETGALIAQAVSLAADFGYAGVPSACPDGPQVERLLGVDPAAEGVLAVLRLIDAGGTDTPADPGADRSSLCRVPTARVVTAPPSVVTSLPVLSGLHAACGIRPAVATRTPREPEPRATTVAVRLPAPGRVDLRDGMPGRLSAPAGFAPAPIDPQRLATVLAEATRGNTGDDAAIVLYVLVLRTSGVASGAYRYDGELTPAGALPPPPALTGRRATAVELAAGEAAAVIVPVGDPLAGVAQHGDLWYRVQQLAVGLVVHRATLAATALGLQARIHSDYCTAVTDAALGLAGSPRRGLSALFIGAAPRRNPSRRAARPGCSPW